MLQTKRITKKIEVKTPVNTSKDATTSSYNPETRITTTKRSWSDTKSKSVKNNSYSATSSKSAKSIAPRPAGKVPVKKATNSETTTKGERSYISFPGPKASGIVNKSEIKAPTIPSTVGKKPIDRKEMIATKLELDKRKRASNDEDYLKQNPGKSLGDRDKQVEKRKKQLASEYEKSVPKASFKNKKTKKCDSCN